MLAGKYFSSKWVVAVIIAIIAPLVMTSVVFAQTNPSSPPKMVGVLNKDVVVASLDDYMTKSRRECNFDMELPTIIQQYIDNYTGVFSCRDFKFRFLRYNKQRIIDPDFNCSTQTTMSVNECEISKRNCKLATFDLKKLYEKCRSEILASETEGQ